MASATAAVEKARKTSMMATTPVACAAPPSRLSMRISMRRPPPVGSPVCRIAAPGQTVALKQTVSLTQSGCIDTVRVHYLTQSGLYRREPGPQDLGHRAADRLAFAALSAALSAAMWFAPPKEIPTRVVNPRAGPVPPPGALRVVGRQSGRRAYRLLPRRAVLRCSGPAARRGHPLRPDFPGRGRRLDPGRRVSGLAERAKSAAGRHPDRRRLPARPGADRSGDRSHLGGDPDRAAARASRA